MSTPYFLGPPHIAIPLDTGQLNYDPVLEIKKRVCYARRKINIILGALWENREVRFKADADPPLYSMSFVNHWHYAGKVTN